MTTQMLTQGRLFRLFISSTFLDLQAERDVLHQRVFPRLQTLCEQHNARFQAVDLRWGITEAASREQRTMAICLQEIGRSRRLSPRLNFVVLLGDRYGWRPLPPLIPEREFDAIRSYLVGDERRVLTTWYERDDNAVPVGYRLVIPQNNQGDDEAAERLRASIIAAARAVGMSDREVWKYWASATEREIAEGLVDGQENVLCFFRNTNLTSNSSEPPFGGRGILQRLKGQLLSGFARHLGRPELDDQTALEQLKDRLRSACPGHVYEYTAQRTGSDVSREHLDVFAEDAFRAFWDIIERELAIVDGSPDAIERERQLHMLPHENMPSFAGRRDYLQLIADYLNRGMGHPCVVHGIPGVGKSALLLQAVREIAATHPDMHFIVRKIGTTARSSDVRSMLETLSSEFGRLSGSNEPLSSDYAAVSFEFKTRLAQTAAQRKLVLVLDGLDQISDHDWGRYLDWLPFKLPKGAWIVVSVAPSQQLDILRRGLPPSALLELRALPATDANELIDTWLEEAQRRITPRQRAVILTQFAECGSLLFLRLAVTLACSWTSTTGVQIEDLPELASELIRRLLHRLAQPSSHGPLLVERALGYIAVAKYGLNESELLDVLSDDDEVMEEFQKLSPKSPPTNRLPEIVWARLLADLQPLLIERPGDSAVSLGFYHREVAHVVRGDYLHSGAGRNRHRKLADYFERRRVLHDENGAERVNPRALAELPTQLVLGELWADFERKVTDLGFLSEVCKRDGLSGLMDDYAMALDIASVPDDLRKIVLDFLTFLRAEATLLRDHPDLVVQQAANTFDGTAPSASAERAAGPVQSAPWLRRINRPRPEEQRRLTIPLVRASAASTVPSPIGMSPVTCCDLSADGTQVVAGMDTGEVRSWDAQNGFELRTFAVEVGEVKCCAFAPDSASLAAGYADGSVRIWDARSGALLHEWAAHSEAVNGLVWNGWRLASYSADGGVQLWDARSGHSLASFLGHQAAVSACSLSPDGAEIVTASDDASLRIWSVEAGRELAVLAGSFEPVHACDYFPDGRSVVSVDRSNTMTVWDRASARAIRRTKLPVPVSDCSATPDGLRIVFVTLFGGVVVTDAATDEYLHGWRLFPGEKVPAHTPDWRTVVSSSGPELQLWSNPLLLASDDQEVPDVGYFADCVNGGLLVGLTNRQTLRVIDADSAEFVSEFPCTAERIVASVFPPGGAYALVETESGEQEVRDLLTGVKVSSIEVNCYGDPQIFSPSGELLVSRVPRDERGVVELRDSRTGEILERFEHGALAIVHAFSPDGKRVAASSDKAIHIWDIADRHVVHRLRLPGPGVPDGPSKASYSADGERLVALYQESLGLWNPRSGDFLGAVRFEVGIWFWCCALFPAGDRICAGSEQWRAGSLVLFDVNEPTRRMVLNGHKAPVRACCISPDGRTIGSGSADGEVKVWNVATGDVVATFSRHTDAVNSCAFSVDGSRLVSASEDGTIRLWDVATQRQAAVFAADLKPFQGAVFLPGGQTLLGISHGGAVYVWDLTSRRQLNGWSADRFVYSAAVSPDGDAIAWTGGPHDPRKTTVDAVLWRANDGIVRHVLSGHASTVTAAAFSPDGKLLGTLDGDGVLRIWDVASGRQMYEVRDVSNTWVVTPDCKTLLTVVRGQVVLYDTSTWDLIGQLNFEDAFEYDSIALSVSPGGERLIVTRFLDRGASVWDIGQRRLISRLSGAAPSNLAFLGCGLYVAGCDRDEVCIWDVNTGERVAMYPLRGHEAVQLVTHPTGRTLAVDDDHGTLHWLRLEGLDPGVSVATPWHQAEDKELRVMGHWSDLRVGCPYCRSAFDVSRNTLGGESVCPGCGHSVLLTEFVHNEP